MAGLKGQSRIPNASQDPRVRRNADNLASNLPFVGGDSVITVDGDGILQVELATNGGLTDTGGALSILLDGNDLELTSLGLSISPSTESRRAAERESTKLEAMAFTSAKAEEAKAISFFYGVM